MINFKTLTSILILVSFLPANNSIAMDKDSGEYGDEARGKAGRAPVSLSHEDIQTIGNNYITFLQKVGQSDSPVTQEDISQLFADHCEKIENGTRLFTLSSKLPDQLNKAREAVGKWTLETLWIMGSSNDRACTIQFVWWGEKMGKHTTMVGLFLDNVGKISQIREVYNEYQKQTLGN